MKDSGIDWIGQIPENWEVKKVKFIVNSISKGNGITKEEVFADGDTPCVRYGEIYSKYNNSFDKCVSKTNISIQKSPHFFVKGDILCAGTGELVEEIGKSIVYMGKEPCLAGGDIIIINHNQNPLFLNYAFNSYYAQAQKSKGKAKLKVVHISPFEIGSILILLPPLQEQQKIAEFLDRKCGEVDEMVALQEKMVEELKAYKQSIISEAVTKGLNPNAPTKDSGIEWIGLIPENWEVSRIASFFTGDVDLNSDFHYQHAYKFYYGTLVPKNEQGNIEQYKETYIKYSVIKANDILLNGLNLNYDFVSQRVAIAPNDGIITSAYIVLRPRESTFAPYFNYLFKAMDNQKLFHGMGKGIRLTLNFDELKRQLIPVPPLQEQQQIADYLDKKCSEVDKLISLKQQKIEALKEYKNSIISEYTTGKKSIA